MTPRYKRAQRAVKRALPDSDLVCRCGTSLDRPKVGRPPVRCAECRAKHRKKYQREWQREKRQRQRETGYWSRVTICKDPDCEEKR